jgi:hypothetical protein
MEKILWYLLFLIVWGALSRAIYIYQRPERRNVKAGIWDQEIMALNGSLVLFLPVLLLAKFSSLLIAGAYFLGAQVDILATVISGEYSRRHAPSQYLAEALWASAAFGIRKPAVGEAIDRGTVVLEVAYPIVAGIVYFTSVIPSEAATLALIRVTLLVVFIGETLMGAALLR